MIIDAHMHFPLEGDAKAAADAMVTALDAAGINLGIVSDLADDWREYPTTEQICKANERAAAAVACHMDRLRYLAYISPRLENALDEIDKNRNRPGCVGLKLWISLRDESGTLEPTRRVLARAAQYDIPVMIHAFDRSDDLLKGEIDNAEFAELAREFPSLTFVCAHLTVNAAENAATFPKELPCTYGDIAGGDPDYGCVELLCNRLGSNRLLFGSDGLGRSLISQLAKVITADLTEEERKAILYQNALAVYRIDPASIGDVHANTSNIPAEYPDPAEDHFLMAGRRFDGQPGGTEVEELENLLAASAISRAYAAPMEAIFSNALSEINRTYAERARKLRILKILAAINPTARSWRDDLRIAQELNAPGLWLSPYLHNYQLNADQFSEFFTECENIGMSLWINCGFYDFRFRFRNAVFRPVATEEILAFSRRHPTLPIVYQNAAEIETLLEAGIPEIQKFDIAFVIDGEGRLAKLVKRFGVKQLVFGSAYPLRRLNTTRYAAGIR